MEAFLTRSLRQGALRGIWLPQRGCRFCIFPIVKSTVRACGGCDFPTEYIFHIYTSLNVIEWDAIGSVSDPPSNFSALQTNLLVYAPDLFLGFIPPSLSLPLIAFFWMLVRGLLLWHRCECPTNYNGSLFL